MVAGWTDVLSLTAINTNAHNEERIKWTRIQKTGIRNHNTENDYYSKLITVMVFLRAVYGGFVVNCVNSVITMLIWFPELASLLICRVYASCVLVRITEGYCVSTPFQNRMDSLWYNTIKRMQQRILCQPHIERRIVQRLLWSEQL